MGLENRIELSSAALETLKILCFDLAALVSGIEGRCLHPRFLLHDSPREADMDAELYHRIFLLAGELEAAFRVAAIQFPVYRDDDRAAAGGHAAGTLADRSRAQCYDRDREIPGSRLLSAAGFRLGNQGTADAGCGEKRLPEVMPVAFPVRRFPLLAQVAEDIGGELEVVRLGAQWFSIDCGRPACFGWIDERIGS